MCTAVTYKTKDFYFGRTLDNDMTYGEEVTVTPRNFPFRLRSAGATEKNRYAMIGMAYIPGEFPLYYDGANEKGLCMAGLNFVGNAVYREEAEGKINVAQFELIPYILGKCATVKEAVELLKQTNLTSVPYSEGLPVAELHWFIADKNSAMTVEFVSEGMKIYDNPVGVLTNNPPFDMQMFRLNDYMGLSPDSPKNTFSEKLALSAYSRGMGALGLPGDLSSASRFVRAAFTRLNSVSGTAEEESVNQFFHILNTVEQTRGCCRLDGGRYEITAYTSCCNADRGIYYYTTYGNHRITAVDMHRVDLNGSVIYRYPLIDQEKFDFQN